MRLGDRGRRVDFALEFVNNDFILLEITVMVPFVPDSMVFTGTTQVRAKLIYFF
jgi:hypothetical protein